MPVREGSSVRRVALVLATSTGGVGRHVHTLAVALRGIGDDVVVCGPPTTDDLFGFTPAGARFHPTDIAPGLAPVADLRAARALRAALRDVDLVHAHGMRAGVVTSVARRGRSAVPFVVTWHNTVLEGTRLRTAYVPFERVIARTADVNLVVSPDLAARVRALGGRDVRLHPVGGPRPASPGRAPDQVRADLGVADRPLVLAVARLHRQKGLDVLVRAAANWADRLPRPVLVVAGDGPDREVLRDLAARLGVPLQLLGRRDDVADLLAAADVVVLPSRWEGSPMVAREALEARRPLVATDVGGVPDLVGPAARLVPPGDPLALSAAVLDALRAPSGSAEQERAVADALARWPDEESTAARVLAAYEELLSR